MEHIITFLSQKLIDYSFVGNKFSGVCVYLQVKKLRHLRLLSGIYYVLLLITLLFGQLSKWKPHFVLHTN